MKYNFLDWTAFILVVVGALNWGLIGFFDFDLVANLAGDMTTASKVVYDLVGIASVYYLISVLVKAGK